MDKLEYIPGDLVFANGKLCEVVGDSFWVPILLESANMYMVVSITMYI